MDNRRLVKWFDIRYHEKFEAFNKVIKPMMNGQLTTVAVWARKPTGQSEWITYYRMALPGTDWHVQLTKGDEPRKICAYFEDPENITDNEWGLFEMCDPELSVWLGKNTLKATDLELMLKGRVMLDVV